MSARFVFLAWVAAAGVFASMPALAQDQPPLSQRLDLLDKRGYFTPAFKAAVHDLVETRAALAQARDEEKKFSEQLPALKKQSGDEQAKVAGLRQELQQYEHPDDLDFASLQTLMQDPAAKPSEQLASAQAYIWAYPGNAHQAQAQQYLQQVQKEIADQQQAAAEAAAARDAAQTKLIQRAKAHDLSMAEWRSFLDDMSQDDVVKFLGPPTARGVDYWTYSGSWSTDPTTQQHVGIQIGFNGGRVLSVSEAQP